MSKFDNNVNVVLIDMPCRIGAYVVENADMTYTIVLNSRRSYEQNLQSYAHEYEHILNEDHERKCTADVIEFEAHHLKKDEA